MNLCYQQWWAWVVALAVHSWVMSNGYAFVFPGPSTDNSHGAYTGIYMAIRGVNQPALTQARIDEIRASETLTRQFYAANSGGQYDIRYTHILDVALTLDQDNRRIGNWWGDAENYVRNTYGIEPENFHANVFDVSATTPDVGQGWSGLAIIPSNNYANQENIATAWGQQVNDHELGHRVGLPHAGALRSIDDDNYTPYVWNSASRQYEVYNEAAHGQRAVTYGIHRDEYGNPFDAMGNISRGHFTVHEKLTDVHWLTSSQVPNLNAEGTGTYRIYAHDELIPFRNNRNGIYGVEETYAAGKLYGLTYPRQAERFNSTTHQFEPYTQTITLEYRTGRDGLQFHLDDHVLDLDAEGNAYDRNNLERELEVGRSVEDIDFGMSMYLTPGGGDNFLSYNPPAPSLPWEIASQWFEFDILQLGSDAIGSYIDVAVSLIDLVAPGDLNNDGTWNVADIAVLRQNWLTDTSEFNSADKFVRGDLDLSGFVDLDDAFLMADVFATHGQPFSLTLTIPEPGSMLLLSGTVIVGLAMRRGATPWQSQRPAERHAGQLPQGG